MRWQLLRHQCKAEVAVITPIQCTAEYTINYWNGMDDLLTFHHFKVAGNRNMVRLGCMSYIKHSLTNTSRGNVRKILTGSWPSEMCLTCKTINKTNQYFWLHAASLLCVSTFQFIAYNFKLKFSHSIFYSTLLIYKVF